MSEIKLLMRNDTELPLVFKYNGNKYDVSAHRERKEVVESGHSISVDAPRNTTVKVNRKSMCVDGDKITHSLEADICIECHRYASNLKLSKVRYPY